MKLIQACMLISGIALASSAYAASVTVTVNSTSADPIKAHGTVTLTETKYGTLLTPNLHDLPPGPHGFHIHEKPSCADNGDAAGGHFDPRKRSQHLGPYQPGHLGDLPTLWVDKEGKATTPVLAPRIKLKDFLGHSLMIHDNGDNYSDTPEKLGGGGGRMACGVINKKADSEKPNPGKLHL